MTVHVGIGYDILHEFPNCDGAAYGATSYTDFSESLIMMRYMYPEKIKIKIIQKDYTE